jgi:hypothetical protein
MVPPHCPETDPVKERGGTMLDDSDSVRLTCNANINTNSKRL